MCVEIMNYIEITPDYPRLNGCLNSISYIFRLTKKFSANLIGIEGLFYGLNYIAGSLG